METSYHDKQAKQTDQSCDDGTAGREAGHLITVEMQGEIDMLFRHKSDSTVRGIAQKVHPSASHLGNMTLGEWLESHGYYCEPYSDALQFNMLGMRRNSRISALLRSVFKSDSDYSTQSEVPASVDLHPFDVLLETYACTKGFSKKSFESLLLTILAVVAKRD